MDIWMGACMGGWMYGRVCVWADVCMGGCIDGWVGRCMDG